MSFEPQNPFEQALVAAASDPAARMGFYLALEDAEFLVIQPPDAHGREGRMTLQQDTGLQLQQIEIEGRPYLPVFSSLPRLRAVLQAEASYLALPARDFIELTSGAELVLNPGSEYGKILTRGELAAILDGSILHAADQRTVERETQILIGQPRRYPEELVAVLRRYFSRQPGISRAWLAHYHDPASEDPPHTLIGIEMSGERDAVMAGAGLAIEGVAIPDPPVDFMQVDGDDSGGVGGYFATVEPFYRRG